MTKRLTDEQACRQRWIDIRAGRVADHPGYAWIKLKVLHYLMIGCLILFSYNQPHISNAFTLQQYYDLRDALLWAKEEKDIKVIVV